MTDRSSCPGSVLAKLLQYEGIKLTESLIKLINTCSISLRNATVPTLEITGSLISVDSSAVNPSV